MRVQSVDYQSINTQQESSTETQKSKNSKRNFVIGLVTMLFVIMLGLGLYFGFKNYYSNQSAKNNQLFGTKS